MAITTIVAPRKMRSGNRTTWTTKFNANSETNANFATGLRRHDFVAVTNDLGTDLTYTDAAPVLNLAGLVGTESAVTLMVIGY